jgi:hypothetical protein
MKNLRLMPPDHVDFVTKMIIMLLLSHGNELLLSKHPRLPIDDVVVNNNHYDDGYQGKGGDPA